MQLHSPGRVLLSGGAKKVGQLGISPAGEDQAVIMRILRDTMYQDPIAAVLREYVSNAWDAHIHAGVTHPIHVQFPTSLEPNLRIRDYGSGLSAADMVEIFVRFGSSTKRGSNTEVGAFGIGSKSAFAYTDVFTVTSWHNKRKCVYTMVLDKADIGAMYLMSDEPTTESGIEVAIPVRKEDFERFYKVGRGYLPYIIPMPTTNIKLVEDDFGEVISVPSGSILIRTTRYRSSWRLQMGCVVYDTPSGLTAPPASYGGVQYDVVLKFDIGELEVTASRESVRANEDTLTAITAKRAQFLSELDGVIVARARAQPSLWAAYCVLRTYLGIPVPSVLASSAVVLPANARAFSVEPRQVTASTVLVVKDECSVNGRKFPFGAMCVKPRRGVSVTAACDALNKTVSDLGITGIPIMLMSELPRLKEKRSAPRPVSKELQAKYRAKVFTSSKELAEGVEWWEPVPLSRGCKCALSPGDVYVELHKFVPRISETAYTMIDALAHVGVELPVVYGVKPSMDVHEEAIPLEQWAGTMVETHGSKLRRVAYKYACRCVCSGYSNGHSSGPWRELADALGSHPVGYILAQAGSSPHGVYMLGRVYSKLDPTQEYIDEVKLILSRYPLLRSVLFSTRFTSVLEGSVQDWVEYVNLIDARNSALDKAGDRKQEG